MSACTASVPKNVNDVCSIFVEKDEWYPEAKHSFVKWGVPIHVTMAIMHQESRFVADATPKQTSAFAILPWVNSSSAYGYTQALDSTWEWYQQKTGNHSADREDFSDAVDFIGWYLTMSQTMLGLSKWDTKNQYLAYHEGHSGYMRKSYLKKNWLQKVALKVDKQSKLYKDQLNQCRDELENKHGFFW
jgi:hypothetical protein